MRWQRIGWVAALVLASLVACRAPAENPPPAAAGRLEGASHGMPPAAEPPARVSLKVPVSAVSGSTLVLPLARDAGLFTKYGLDVEVITINGSSLVVQSMLAGDLPISAVSSAAVVEADLAGADIRIVAGVVNQVVNVIMALPTVASADDLRGRRVGIPRLGDSTDFLTRLALRQRGLEPDRDVTVLQIGANQEILTAMQNGALDAGTMSSPSTIRGRHLGYYQILDLGALGVPYQHTTVNVVGKYLEANPDAVRRFLQAYVEAIYLYRADKPFTQKVLAEFARTDDTEVLDETWDL